MRPPVETTTDFPPIEETAERLEIDPSRTGKLVRPAETTASRSAGAGDKRRPVVTDRIFQSFSESLRSLTSQVLELKAFVAEARRQRNVFIGSFKPEPYTLKRPIPVNLQPSGDGFIATFFDANISTSGETEEEAFSNLRSLLLDTLDSFASKPADDLGPEPTRQLAVLRHFIRRSR